MDAFVSNFPALFITAFFAILFLQSGLDMVTDYAGNFSYLSDHFKNSPLAGSVKIMLPVITFLEMATGLISAWSLLQLLLSGQSGTAIFSPALAAISLLCLFFGQRIAKDYAGAAALVPYFAVALLGIWMIKM